MKFSLKNRFISSLMWMSAAISCQALAAEQAASPVKVDLVTQQSIAATTDLMATLHSRSHLSITAGVNGRLAWLVEPGTHVKKGDTLVKMDLLPLQLKLAEQKAQLKRAEINTAYLKNEWDRLQTLQKTKATSQFQLDQTRSQYQLSQTDIEIAQLKLKQIQDQLDRAVVKAPFDGVITQREVRAGSDVNRSDTLLKLLDVDNLEARVFVPVKYLPYINLQQQLTVHTQQKTIAAQVIAKIPSADQRSQTFEVRIALPKPKNQIWAPGQLVKVTIPTQDAQQKLMVHRDALILRKQGTYVIKVDTSLVAHKLAVKVGQGSLDRVSVESIDEKQLLSVGDQVAVRGAERVKEGQKVSLK